MKTTVSFVTPIKATGRYYSTALLLIEKADDIASIISLFLFLILM